MGNLIKSCENNIENVQRQYANSLPNNSALGRFSTRQLNEKFLLNKEKNKFFTQMKKKIKKCEYSTIYKDVFAPSEKEPELFTVCIRNSDIEESKRTSLDSIHNDKIGFKRKIILIQSNKRYTQLENKSINSSMSTQAECNKRPKFKCINDSLDSGEIRVNISKTGEEIRKSYISKLITKDIWQPPTKEKGYNSLFIFDWDDTLLCTSYLTPNGEYNEKNMISDGDLHKIKKIETSVKKLLKLAVSKGTTFIITNAAPGWVEYSARKFFPSVIKILSHVNIISARDKYEKKFPGDTRKWKILSFLNILNEIDTNLVTNIICIGDSAIEIEAAHVMATKFKQAYIKTVKFKHSPRLDELYKQINLVIDQFYKIYGSIKNMNIKVTKKEID